MAAIAILLLLIVLVIILIINSLVPPHTFLGITQEASFLLFGCLVGIIMAALLVGCVLYQYNKNRKAILQMHGWKILAHENDSAAPVVANNTGNTYVKSQKSVSVMSPSSPCSCRKELHVAQQKNINTVIDQNESKHYTSTTLQLDSLHPTKTLGHHTHLEFAQGSSLNKIQENPIPKLDAAQTIGHHARLEFTQGSSLNKTQENPIPMTDTAQKHPHNLTLTQGSVISGTPSQLESHC